MLRKLIILLKNNLIGAGLSYVLTISLANSFGPERFGFYSLLLIWANMVGLLVVFGTDNTASKYLVTKGEIEKTVNGIFIFKVTNFLIICSLIILFQSVLPASFYFIIFLLISSLNLAFIFEIREKVVQYSYIFLLERVIYASIALIYIYLSDITDVITILWLYLTVTIFSLLLQLVYLRQGIKLNISGLKQYFSLISLNTPVVISAVVVFSYGGLSRLILENTHSTIDLGIYSVAWQFIALGTMFQAAVDRVWRKSLTLSLADSMEKDSRNLITTYVKYTSVPVIVFSVTLFACKGIVVDTIFSTEYNRVVDILPAVCLYFIVINLNGLANICCIAKEQMVLLLSINSFFALGLLMTLYYQGDKLTLGEFAFHVVIFHLFCVISLILCSFMVKPQKNHLQKTGKTIEKNSYYSK